MMTKQDIKNKEIFLNICQLAREQNKKKLQDLVDNGADINMQKGDFSPVGMLAYRGELEATIFLIEHFKANKTQALVCAAWNYKVDILDYFLQRIDMNTDQKDIYTIYCGILRHDNFHHILLDFFRRYPPIRDFICNNKDLATKLLTRSIYAKEIVESSKHHSNITYHEIEDWLTKNKSLNDNLLDDIDTIGHLIVNPLAHYFNFAQIQAWTLPNLHAWFLIGIEKYRDQSCTLEIFIKISALAFNLLEKEILTLLQAHLAIVPKLLRNYSINKAEERYHRFENKIKRQFFSIFSQDDALVEHVEAFNKEIELAEKKYQDRTNFASELLLMRPK